MLVNNNVTQISNKDYLDFSKLGIEKKYKRIAYVQDVRDGMDKHQQGFYTFFLKDCNGDMLVGRMFNVPDYMELARKARALKNSPVTIEFYTQSFNGSLSIVITSIDIYTEGIEFEKFIGKIKNYESIIKNLENLDNYETLVDSHLTKFYGGKVGGFSLFSYLVLEQVKSYSMTGICNYNVLKRSTECLIPLLFDYYRLLEISPVIDPATLITNVSTIIMMNSLEEDTAVLADAYCACCKLAEPCFLESRLLYSIVENVMSAMVTSEMVQAMTGGSVKELNDGTILKKL